MNPKDLLQYLLSGLSFILMLTVLVAVHEYGHFIFARMFGMKVKSFNVFIGGLRTKGIVEGLCERKMVPASALWTAGLLALVVMIATTKVPAIYFVALFFVALILPAWVVSRIALLYHLGLPRAIQIVSYVFVLFVGIALLAGKSPSAQLAILMAGAWIGVLILYYQPVLQKDEGAEHGQGVLDIEGESVKVPFRPVWSIFDKKGTEYALLCLPLGGFVSIQGMEPKEDGSEWQEENGFFTKRPFARLMVLFAGPLFSFLLGSLLLTTYFATQGPDKLNNVPIVGTVGPGKAADRAGIMVGDRIVSVDAQPVTTFFDVVKYVRDKPGVSIRLAIQRGNQDLVVAVIPELDKEPSDVLLPDMTPSEEKKVQAKLGLAPTFVKTPMALGEAAKVGFTAPYMMVSGMIELIAKKPQEFAKGVGGITSVAAETHTAAQEGPWRVVQLAGFLSITLGIMNLLPIVPLDGGQMLMTLIEWARGNRRLDIGVRGAISTVGIALLLIMMIVVTTMDIGRLGK